MSKVFYDHLVVLKEVEVELTSHSFTSGEKHEVHQMIEETVHFRVMGRILDHLPHEHHSEFLELFHKAPYHRGVLDFLKEKVEDIEEAIKDEIMVLEKELLEDIGKGKKKAGGRKAGRVKVKKKGVGERKGREGKIKGGKVKVGKVKVGQVKTGKKERKAEMEEPKVEKGARKVKTGRARVGKKVKKAKAGK